MFSIDCLSTAGGGNDGVKEDRARAWCGGDDNRDATRDSNGRGGGGNLEI